MPEAAAPHPLKYRCPARGIPISLLTWLVILTPRGGFPGGPPG
jgi:hypothetical protein